MRQKIIFFICLIFFSFTKENEIVINNPNSKIVVKDIYNQILANLTNNKTISGYYEQIYAFNPESCKRRETYLGYENYENCYMSLKYNDKWYYFCGTFNETEIKEKGFDVFIDEVKNYTESIKELKIDCFSQKLYYNTIIKDIFNLFKN